jgi:murein DD-endopeptidase MepM/ murein hydrolase activator NlpD
MNLKYACFFILLLISLNSFSQIKLKTYHEKSSKGFLVFADNEEYCPLAVKVDFELDNMKSTNGNHRIFVIPPRAKRILISELKMIENGKFGFRYKTKSNYGNPNDKMDTSYVYSLPFKTQKSFKISQGYFGKRTHHRERALDFTLPIGTNIYAAREGVVIKVVDQNTKTCYKKECSKFNNEIIIYHNDGSFSNYVHINTNSAKVNVGEKIKKNQLIAQSGNIGWSSGPHLHFSVYTQKLERRFYYETKFKVYKDGVPLVLKREGVYYLD